MVDDKVPKVPKRYLLFIRIIQTVELLYLLGEP